MTLHREYSVAPNWLLTAMQMEPLGRDGPDSAIFEVIRGDSSTGQDSSSPLESGDSGTASLPLLRRSASIGRMTKAKGACSEKGAVCPAGPMMGSWWAPGSK